MLNGLPPNFPITGRLPVRTEPRTAGEEALERENHALQEQGESLRYLPAEEEVEYLRERAMRGGGVPRGERAWVERLISHPDERVRLACLHQGWLHAGEYRDLATHLYVEGWKEAEAEGVLWTPVLDALDSLALWPVGNQEYTFRGIPRTSAARAAVAHLADLVPHLAACSDPEEWLRVGEMGSGSLKEIGARAHRPIPDTRVRTLWYRAPGSWSELAQNPHLGEEDLRWLEAEAREVVFRSSDWSRLNCALSALGRLSERGVSLQPESRDALSRHLRRALQEDSLPTLLALNANMAFFNLARQEALEPSHLETALTFARSSGRRLDVFLARLVDSPSAGPELWLRLLREQRTVEVRRLVAAHPPARQTAAVRTLLARSRDALTLDFLCEDALPDLRRLLPRLAGIDPERARARVESLSHAQIGQLDRTSLAALLASSEERLRVAALRLVAPLGASAPAPGSFARRGTQ